MNPSDVSYSLRVFGVSPVLIDQVEKSVSKQKITVRKYFKDKTKLVLVVELEDGDDLETLAKIVSLATVKYDLFISMNSESDSEILEVPKYILKFLRATDAELTCSFTVIS